MKIKKNWRFIYEKTLSITITVVILFSFATTSYAKEHSGWHSTIIVNGEEKSLIKNQYFKLYYNDFFETYYASYKSTLNTLKGPDSIEKQYFVQKLNNFFGSEDIKKIGIALYEELKTSEDIYYLSLYLNYSDGFSEEKNKELLKDLSDFIDIVYCGSTTPCVIISTTGKNIDKIIDNENVEFTNYPFMSSSYIPGSKSLESGNRTYSPNAQHARNVLRYAAGLYNPADSQTNYKIKEFFLLSDVDFDGKITAADARIALRISARIDATITFSHATDSFWDTII